MLMIPLQSNKHSTLISYIPPYLLCSRIASYCASIIIYWRMLLPLLQMSPIGRPIIRLTAHFIISNEVGFEHCSADAWTIVPYSLCDGAARRGLFSKSIYIPMPILTRHAVKQYIGFIAHRRK